MRSHASRSKKRIHTEFDHYSERLGANHTVLRANLAAEMNGFSRAER